MSGLQPAVQPCAELPCRATELLPPQTSRILPSQACDQQCFQTIRYILIVQILHIVPSPQNQNVVSNICIQNLYHVHSTRHKLQTVFSSSIFNHMYSGLFVSFVPQTLEGSPKVCTTKYCITKPEKCLTISERLLPTTLLLL